MTSKAVLVVEALVRFTKPSISVFNVMLLSSVSFRRKAALSTTLLRPIRWKKKHARLPSSNIRMWSRFMSSTKMRKGLMWSSN